MDRREYEVYKQKVEADFKESVENAQAERQKKLEAIEIVWSMRSPADDQKQRSTSTQRSAAKKVTKAKKAKASEEPLTQAQFILHLAKQIDGDFSQPDLREVLKRDYPELVLKLDASRISTILKDLTEKGEVERVGQAHGSRPIIYRLKPKS